MERFDSRLTWPSSDIDKCVSFIIFTPSTSDFIAAQTVFAEKSDDSQLKAKPSNKKSKTLTLTNDEVGLKRLFIASTANGTI